MDGLEKRVALAIGPEIVRQCRATGDPREVSIPTKLALDEILIRIDGVVDLRSVARAVLEEIKPAVISMFRVMAQPGIPALTPEQRWDAMMREFSEENEE